MVDLAHVSESRTVCDPACGTGNILLGVIRKLKSLGKPNHEIIDAIYGYDIVEESVQVCRSRIMEALPDIPASTVEQHISCCDSLAAVVDRFDIIIMNPPYAKDLHKKFLIWAAGHADAIVSIQPCQFLYKHLKLNKLDMEVQKTTMQFARDIYIMNPNLIWKDHKFGSPVGIFFMLTLDTEHTVQIHDEMTDDTYAVSDINEIYKRHTQLKDYIECMKSWLWEHPDTVTQHRNKNKSDKSYVVELARIRGHISEVNTDIYSNDDFATMVTRGHAPRLNEQDKAKQHYYFKTKQEAENFIDYLKTDFARLCLYVNKFGLHIDSYNMGAIPWLDFTKKWTDDELFGMIGTGNPNLADPTLLPAYYKD